MSVRLSVVCSGRQSHGRREVDRIDVADTEIKQVPIRTGRQPVRGSILPVPQSEDEAGTFWWKCDRCMTTKVPLSEDDVRKWVVLTTARSGTVLDLSHLPSSEERKDILELVRGHRRGTHTLADFFLLDTHTLDRYFRLVSGSI